MDRCTYHTPNEAKYKKYNSGDIEFFIKEECKKVQCDIDMTTLNASYRNNEVINMGEVKGLTFERVLIYPTGPMLN